MDSRSRRAYKNVAGLIAIRGTSALLNLALIPIAITSLNPFDYGIWITLTSTLNWISLADLGLGNGLRNRFSEAVALGENERARAYVSTTYVLVSIVVFVSILLYLACAPLLNWAVILNISEVRSAPLSPLAAVVFGSFALRLLLGLVGTIFTAHQDPALAGLIDLATNALTLGVVLLVVAYGISDLLVYGVAVSCASIIMPVFAHGAYFVRPFRLFRPSLKYFDSALMKNLLSLGWQFFLLQVAFLAIFASTNLVIIRMFGPSEVTSFNVVFRYYGTAGMAFTIVLTPFWSAYSEAYARRDLRWIRATLRRLQILWWGLVVGVVFMTVASSSVYRLWVGPSVAVNPSLSVAMACYTVIGGWCAVYANLLNGLGKIRLQLSVAIVAALAVVPLATCLGGTLGLGTMGVTTAICVCLLPGCVLWPIQARRLLLRKAKGIWAL